MISALLLAAGESKRMGMEKLSLLWGRRTVLEVCLRALVQSKTDEVIVVLNDRIKGLVSHVKGQKVKAVMNPFYKRGMSSSIQRGLQALHPCTEGILIALGDQPLLKTRTINALIHAFRKGGKGIIVPSFQGKRGNPVIFHRKYREDLQRLKGDVGGRSIIDRHLEDTKMVRTKSEGVVRDIDTWEDYRKGSRFKNKE